VASSNVSFVPLVQASLCLDCETITAANTNCLACGSHALLNVARVLNEPVQERKSRTPIPITLAARDKVKRQQVVTVERIKAAEQQLFRLPFRISENRA
jgi:hypothetical protein